MSKRYYVLHHLLQKPCAAEIVHSHDDEVRLNSTTEWSFVKHWFYFFIFNSDLDASFGKRTHESSQENTFLQLA